MRGVRVNLEVSKGADATDALRRLSATAEALGGSPLLIQVYAAMPVVLACAPTLRTSHQKVLIDHFGLARTGSDPGKAGISALLEVVASPNIWMKLSGPYQVSSASPDHADITTIAEAMIATSPDRIVWGSDWPHTGCSARPANHRPTDLEPFRTEDDRRNFGLLWKWAPEESLRRRVLVDNPAHLFGFRQSGFLQCAALLERGGTAAPPRTLASITRGWEHGAFDTVKRFAPISSSSSVVSSCPRWAFRCRSGRLKPLHSLPAT